ncbi:MAG TPA: FAD-dependent oxidoreductase [Pirellula sp.]|nr:FAD-dependent oxidoreductase [Pirellula sp.]
MKPLTLKYFAVWMIVSIHLQVTAADRYDLVVYGGTSGGVTAAVQCSRMGKTVVLIESTQFLGGLTTGGLGATDIGNKRAIGGLSREFYQRIYKYYLAPERWTRETREVYFKDRVKNEESMWTFEPSVATKIFNDMITEAKVPVVFGQRLNLKNGVIKDGARITKIVMESGRSFEASVFIDATYEGDLMAKAGVSYHVGRESNQTYAETINGLQMKGTVHHQFVKQVDPYIKPGNPSSGLLPGVTAMPVGKDGDGDHRIQAYNFRLCTTDIAENRRPWPKPEGYNELRYELLLRNFEAGDKRVPWHPLWMPNRKSDTNNNFAFSTDNIGMNYEYPDGDYPVREKIWKEHEQYTQGLMWTLANHPRVPESVRQEFNRIALVKDEFVDNDNWPRQLYVREARRMVSDYVMSEKNCKRIEIVADSVGMGAYNMDSHNTQRYVTQDGFARNEGDIQIGTKPYPISYRSIRPKAEQCTNLLVPVCLAASHISYGSIRMEPVFMVMGQSAATAAVHAINEQTNVQRIDPDKLQKKLLKDGQMLDFES